MFLFRDPSRGFTLCFTIGVYYNVPVFSIMLPIFLRKIQNTQNYNELFHNILTNKPNQFTYQIVL